MVSEDKVLTRQLIQKWHDRAKIDYSDLFVKEYIAYNAWFRKVTDCDSDHEAIRRVMNRFVIWDDYIHGRTLADLRPIVESIAAFTLRHRRSALVKDCFDWKNLISFWYETRCGLFHGLTMPGKAIHDAQIKLAYESLAIFMNEIIRRMRHCFDDSDFKRLTEVKVLQHSDLGADEALNRIETRLHLKFIHSPDLWNVDMERV